VPQGLAAVYDHWSYLDEKREALDAWAVLLKPILDPAPARWWRGDEDEMMTGICYPCRVAPSW
jgi:hypothetical protein